MGRVRERKKKKVAPLHERSTIHTLPGKRASSCERRVEKPELVKTIHGCLTALYGKDEPGYSTSIHYK